MKSELLFMREIGDDLPRSLSEFLTKPSAGNGFCIKSLKNKDIFVKLVRCPQSSYMICYVYKQKSETNDEFS